MANTIDFITEDSRKLSVKSNSVDLIVTQLPFYQLDFLNYGGIPEEQIGSEKTTKKYVDSLLKVTKQMERVLKPTGSIFVVAPSMNVMYYEYLLRVLKKTDLILANPPFIWNWSDSNKEPELGSISFDYDLIFHFVRSPKLVYHNPYSVRKYSQGVWDIPWSDNSNSIVKKIETVGFIGNSFRAEIPKRLIEMFSKPNDVVLDPFGGSGTTVCEAYLLNRTGISVDVSEEQTDLAKIRLGFVKDNA